MLNPKHRRTIVYVHIICVILEQQIFSTMPQGSDWYYSQHEPERERNNKFLGFLILVGFILICIFSLTFIAEYFGKG